MKRKIIGAGLFCLVLFAAILAGYWDMLSTEKLKIVRGETSESVGEIADVVRKDGVSSASAPSAGTPDATPDGGAASSAGGAQDQTPPAVSPAAVPAVPSGERPVAETPASTPAAPPVPAADRSALDAEAPLAAGTPTSPVPVAPEAPVPLPATPAADGSAATPTTAAEPATGLPTFDIVRVDPDGSTVLAGRAPAGSTVALLDGTTRIGGDTASASGDFVVALEEPLKVGEHQLTLQAVTPDGRAATSAETAIVSIPEKGRENELLAVIQSPDSPSRLISLPSAAASESASASSEPPAVAAGSQTAGAPMLPSASPENGEEAALTLPLASGEPAASAVALAVEAVEIEGNQIYVAGRASGAATVRVYIDEEFLAAAPKVTAERFLVTATVPVRPGDHLVRADALDGAGTVIARVEVPFSRPAGQAMAAISAPRALPDAPTAPVTAPSQGASTVAADAAPTDNAPLAESADPAAPDALAPTASSLEAAATPGSLSTGDTAPAPAAAAAPAGSGAAEGEGVAVLRQPALEAAEARVIIRRGDTLWRISRDTYGRGARYTVIYLANGDQIRDPDRIYPGQVFRTPKDEAVAAPATPGTPGQ